MQVVLDKRKREFYKIVENNPVARFYYRGSHKNPVRRTVIVTESTKTTLTGYELRAGSIVRNNLSEAPVKIYSRSCIAKQSQVVNKKKGTITVNRSSLVRLPLIHLLRNGV